MKTNTIIIEKVVNGGIGLGRNANGQVVLIGESLPGEELTYVITGKRKKTLFGRVEQLITQSKDRISPPCPYFGECGGCDLQHAAYHAQLSLKKSIVDELFHSHNTCVAPMMPSPLQFRYRQRIRLQVQDGKIGFNRHKSNDIVAIRGCLLAHPMIDKTLKKLVQEGSFHELCSVCREVELHYNPQQNNIWILFRLTRKPRPSDRNRATLLHGRLADLGAIFFHGNGFTIEGPFPPENPQRLCQTVRLNSPAGSLLLDWEIGGFCQVNIEQNEKLIHYLRKLCHNCRDHDVLDLFCGMGNFSIPLAMCTRSITGIEGQGSSIRCARFNSERAQLDNTTFIKASIHNKVRELEKTQRRYDTIVLDPPRQGIPGLAHSLGKIAKNQLLYISCDPATLARDCDDLCREGFSLVSVQPFDMFPQTHHIESVARLKRK